MLAGACWSVQLRPFCSQWMDASGHNDGMYTVSCRSCDSRTSTVALSEVARFSQSANWNSNFEDEAIGSSRGARAGCFSRSIKVQLSSEAPHSCHHHPPTHPILLISTAAMASRRLALNLQQGMRSRAGLTRSAVQPLKRTFATPTSHGSKTESTTLSNGFTVGWK
jgi:hypothetical protein